MLDVRDLVVRYGGVTALHGCSLHVDTGEIVALLGGNGAGKTTMLRSISGLVRPASGSVAFLGRSLSGTAPFNIARSGLVHAPEGRRIFTRMTIRENLDLGAYAVRSRQEADRRRQEVLSIFPRLQERLDQSAGTLSGGEQQMLAIGRALMAGPQLLLLDEPSLGLAPLFVQTIFKVIREINERGTAVLLVEQNARAALHIAARAYLLENGCIVREASAEAMLDDPSVVAAYLGA
ncbi:MAG: ABC transporter ATP-binding protein [Vulcanimicrobiaceae bacterium]